MDFVVLSSSRGTTFQAVLDCIADGSLTARCLGLISSRSDRGCIEKARAAELPVAIVERREGEKQETYDKRLQEAIINVINFQFSNSNFQTNSQFSILNSQFPSSASPTSDKQRTTSDVLLACMGWMFIFSPWFIGKWRNRMINIHPALLPKYGGKGMYGSCVHEAVLKAGERESGMTIHLMDEGVDTGKILLQKRCAVQPGDTVATLKERVQALEREWYPRVLQMIEESHLTLD